MAASTGAKYRIGMFALLTTIGQGARPNLDQACFPTGHRHIVLHELHFRAARISDQLGQQINHFFDELTPVVASTDLAQFLIIDSGGYVHRRLIPFSINKSRF